MSKPWTPDYSNLSDLERVALYERALKAKNIDAKRELELKARKAEIEADIAERAAKAKVAEDEELTQLRLFD